MKSKSFVISIIIKVIACVNGVQKVTPKYHIQTSNSDVKVSLQPDKNTFPDVVYPTSILDIGQPFYFNSDNKFEVLEPFSEDVKSSYKLLSSIARHANKKCKATDLTNRTAINEGTNRVQNVTIEYNITEHCHNDDEEASPIVLDDANDLLCHECQNCTDSSISNEIENTYFNNTFSNQMKKETKTPIYVTISIQVFKDGPDLNRDEDFIALGNNTNVSREMDQNKESLEQHNESYSSEQINISSEEHYTELQNINKTDIINALSLLLLESLRNRDNVSENFNTTFIGNESLEIIALEATDNCTFPYYPDDNLELNLTNSNFTMPLTDFEEILNSTIDLNDEEYEIDNKEDYFLDFVISLDSFCQSYDNTNENITDYDYRTEHRLEEENSEIK